ncbi:multiple RNA-binding protein domain-containing protein 1 [Sporothrix schenckii 1099-18]|uniref:Multiple RNA-binding domain-containing protein 1 n=1 Tax=Sporothrix schenckii 1099-18 TaxID=1397361 RepID=A0A0F2MCL9_SPOSC|nr:multiple RNA-binding protein domain-containing protein 1 [Sporothrix schenckii 1099-18]KJR85906.1 multiple RNA-binding protein domain-containing protein 1 [Sporothrix schenckii 1099-18]
MASSFPKTEAAAAGSNSPPDDAPVEESSRIFVKNLPPNITDDQLRKHFSGGGRHITDLKLIARRRIAFIGYRSADEAKAAVRYFNRSFIRMSKLSVELAKPITDPTLPTAYKMQRLHDLHNPAAAEPAAPALPADDEAASKKRKREDLDVASNPKLREFLDVMSTQNRGLSSTADVTSAMGAGAFGVAGEAAVPEVVLDAEESENEDEYQSISTKKAKTTKDDEGERTPEAPVPAEPAAEAGRPSRVAAITATSIEEEEARPTPPAPEPTPTPLQPKLDASATDDDWLRSRTNRLLDLLDPSELPAPPQPVAAPPVASTLAPAIPAATPAATKKADEELPDANNENDNENDDYENPIRRLAPAAAAAATAAATTATPTPAPPVVPLSAEEQIRKTSRLFVRNLPYDATEAQIQKYFTAFGTVQEVQLPVTNSGVNKGYAMVLFASPDVALAAFHNTDGKTFQGRILHVLPAKAKKTAGSAAELDEFALAKLPLKQQRLLRKKADAATSSFSWNALFMTQDAVNSAMAERLGVSKSEMLDPTSSDEAVRQAVRQTSIIEETKDYFESNGVDLEAFKPNTKRGDSCILVKNFAHGTASQELRKMFEEYGPVVRVLMPPSGTLAIVQFAQAAHGRLAYAKLAYRRVNETVLMLEKCPDNLLSNSASGVLDTTAATAGQAGKTKLVASDLLDGSQAEDAAGDETTDEAAAAGSKQTSSLFVRNLNFTTTTEQLAALFSPLQGFVAARVKTKPDPKRPGQTLSMGYGFVEFRTKADAAGACATMDGHILHGHTLAVKASHRGLQDAAAAQREADQAKKLAANRGGKLIIKNIPFEASRTDLRTLLGTYGQLKAVRMPKKFGSATRGYAFAEFVTAREAAAAMTALRNTHLLGRRLVIEFAEAEAVDAEEEIAKMQKKVGSQMDSVARQQLATSRSHRTKVTIGDEEEEQL